TCRSYAAPDANVQVCMAAKLPSYAGLCHPPEGISRGDSPTELMGRSYHLLEYSHTIRRFTVWRMKEVEVIEKCVKC
ncbi:MAG: hypothetical protein Q4B72_15215, partial [Lachnospiraceae bacterium]|nr:hypothetical protein [Lachnospiraceae bacterium]